LKTLWRTSLRDGIGGQGGLYASGRWHTRGHPVVYCAFCPPGALLEMLVHAEVDPEDVPDKYLLLELAHEEVLDVEEVNPADLPADWQLNERVTRAIGDTWLRNKASAVLKVPSAIMPKTWNALLNPMHTNINQIQLVETVEANWDRRLFNRE